jgi:hypothetical protein
MGCAVALVCSRPTLTPLFVRGYGTVSGTQGRSCVDDPDPVLPAVQARCFCFATSHHTSRKSTCTATLPPACQLVICHYCQLATWRLSIFSLFFCFECSWLPSRISNNRQLRAYLTRLVGSESGRGIASLLGVSVSLADLTVTKNNATRRYRWKGIKKDVRRG